MSKYKAKSNIYCDGKSFVAGEVYDEKDIKGMDKNDFEKVNGEKPKAKKKK